MKEHGEPSDDSKNLSPEEQIERATIDSLWQVDREQNRRIRRSYTEYFEMLSPGPASGLTNEGISAEEFDKLLSCGKILDVGCGEGRFITDCLAKGFDAYGIDLALRNEEGRQWLNKHNPTASNRIVAGDATSLPYQSDSFATIMNMWGVPNYLYRPDAMPTLIDEELRVLRKTGKIIFAPIIFEDDEFKPNNLVDDLNYTGSKNSALLEKAFTRTIREKQDTLQIKTQLFRGDEYEYQGHLRGRGFLIAEKL